MLDNIIIQIAIITQLTGLPLPEAVSYYQTHYMVPTLTTEQPHTAEQPTSTFSVQLASKRTEIAIPPHHQGEEYATTTEATTALVMDAGTQRILLQQNPEEIVPIASITKLMTALVWLEYQPNDGFDHVHTFGPEDDTPGGKELDLPHGEKLTAYNLLRTALIESDNDAALAMAHTTGLTDAAFVEQMNEKARSLGMLHTTFVDPTGLGEGNISSARDIAILAREAFRHSAIQEASQQSEHAQETVDSKKQITVYTTNQLLYDPDVTVIGGKTGFTDEAGYCFVTQVREPNSDRDIIVVVLGTDTDAARFAQAKRLIEWTFAHYEWER